MPRPCLLLVTRSHEVYELFCRQLHDMFSDAIELLDAAELGVRVEADLALCSYREALREHGLPEERTIVARRTVDLTKVTNLVQLPPGTRCLVVNNSYDTALETVASLENLGLDLRLYPYDPGAPMPDGIEVALVAATGRAYVPPAVDRVVDIGLRPIDYTTLLEIAFRLDIPFRNSQLYSSTYIRQIVQLSLHLSESLRVERMLNRQMDAIFQTVHEGLVALAEDGRVVQANRAAHRILGLDPGTESLVGRRLWDVVPSFPELTDITSEENIYAFHESFLVISRTDVSEGDIGSVLAFQDVTRLQKLEQDFRRKVQSKGLLPRYSTQHIVAQSPSMVKVLEVVEKIARTDRTVLILGESGTGKELIAHTIHQLSARREGPFLPVNFAGLPATLAESELFGYEEGAFTGARRGGKPGLFELAHNGTLFLDEIGDAPFSIQALLLRVLQERQVMRIGGDRMIPVDVRIVAATNRDLKQLIREGKFREDLYYRLFVLPVYIPPLRERREDIPLLVEHFLIRYGGRRIRVADAVMCRLQHYDWPGNVRELESVVQYMVTVCEASEIGEEDLPPQFREHVADDVDDEDDMVDALRTSGDLDQFTAVLEALSRASEIGMKSVGRSFVASFIQGYPVHLSESQVRHRMEVLRNLGLIRTGTRRQGSALTEKGVKVLEVLRRGHTG
ncbi:sigma 54-interacting transcriptional regulator [Kyrpidia sp.]|uniref:sigma-54 interaction domain-containing protein n=1 Tax=Kyrpidia sp. TaxID=2073077 RepID=UPI00258459A1|nr:sigma 54-interacting transcriptional regulator [Kyrpidia sp.]MCL6577102.1 sigma 54-interacting transcriptional regulator [Kyrpidia sp.]